MKLFTVCVMSLFLIGCATDNVREQDLYKGVIKVLGSSVENNCPCVIVRNVNWATENPRTKIYRNTIYYKETEVKREVARLNRTGTGNYDWIVYN